MTWKPSQKSRTLTSEMMAQFRQLTRSTSWSPNSSLKASGRHRPPFRRLWIPDTSTGWREEGKSSKQNHHHLISHSTNLPLPNFIPTTLPVHFHLPHHHITTYYSQRLSTTLGEHIFLIKNLYLKKKKTIYRLSTPQRGLSHLALFPALSEDLPVVGVGGVLQAEQASVTEPGVGGVRV